MIVICPLVVFLHQTVSNLRTGAVFVLSSLYLGPWDSDQYAVDTQLFVE